MKIIEATDNIIEEAVTIEGANSVQKKRYSQFFTPSDIASFMASLFTFKKDKESIKILDPGAGVGILSSAVVDRLISSNLKLKYIEVTAIEIDSSLQEQLTKTYESCNDKCREAGINFSFKIINEDFIKYGYSEVINSTGEDLLFTEKRERTF